MRECAFTEISARGDFYALRGALRSFSQPRKTRAHLRAILLEAHLCISESETLFAPDTIGRFLPLTFVRWFDPSEGRIFVVFLSNSFWQICRSAALEIVLIIFDKFAVFGRSKNGVSSFSWYLRRTVNKEKTALTRAVIMFLWFFMMKKSRKKGSKKARLLLWWDCPEIIT